MGYELDKAEGVVLKISKDNKFVENAKEGDEVEVITNQTPFYGESGGQVGDQGIISNSKCKINIKDTQKKNGRPICSLWNSSKRIICSWR